MNRCIVLTVDESREQTERIHALQRKARTLEGLRLKKKRRRILDLLQNAQRLLEPVDIINPFADELTFTAERTRTRRDHEKYLTLIEAVTLLHQHQRPLEDRRAKPARTSRPRWTTSKPPTPRARKSSAAASTSCRRRRAGMLEALKKMVAALCEKRAIDQDRCHFTRREVREHLRWSETQIRLHMQRLEDLEYLARRHGRQGIGCVYELMIDASEPEGVYLVGLLDAAELKKRAQL